MLLSKYPKFKKNFSLLILLGLVLSELAYADILIQNSARIRARIGANGTTVSTVIYEAGIPAELGGLTSVTAVPNTVSTNKEPGGTNTYTIRIFTDVNSRTNTANPLTATFHYDSSSPLSCITPANCGATTINFSQISWNYQDGDPANLNTVTSYDNSAAQLFQTQTDTNQAKVGLRHRNRYQFIYDNDLLLPAGTYEGTIMINGEAL